jgi:hypothetical protein
MAKRFIDTNIFADETFCNYSKDGKLFFIYFITNCDHAGILKLNPKLLEFQTGIKSYLTVIKELGKSLVTVKEQSNIYFMPGYLKFQYPNFPKSNVKQQEGAITILKNYGLWDEKSNSYQTVTQELPNSYVYVNDNDNVNTVIEEKIKIEKTDFEWAVFHFIEMRKKKRSEPTPHALDLIYKELEKLAEGNEKLKIEILNQSTKCGWLDVFPLKNKNQTLNGTNNATQKPINTPALLDRDRRNDES